MNIRRPDLSRYLVHLSRDLETGSARANVLDILTSGTIEARNPYGIAGPHFEHMGWTDRALTESQKVACFSETPLAHLDGLIDPGIPRRYHFRPYGVVFTREYMLRRGANPVGYMNQFPGDRSVVWMVRHYNALIDAAVLDNLGRPDAEKFAKSPVAKITPFREPMGRWSGKWKDFSFEREWRFLGDFRFSLFDVAAVVVRAGDENSFRWDLKLSGLDDDHVSGLRVIGLDDHRAAAA